MKRDMELVRAILLTIEKAPGGFAPSPFMVEGYDPDVIGHHVWLMEQGQLLTAAEITAQQDPSPTAIPEAITWKGHEFLDAVRNDTVWTKVKIELKDRAISLPFALLQDLAIKILAAHVGLPPQS